MNAEDASLDTILMALSVEIILTQGCVLTALSINHCTHFLMHILSVGAEVPTFTKLRFILGDAHQQFQVSRQTGRLTVVLLPGHPSCQPAPSLLLPEGSPKSRWVLFTQ